MLSPELTGAMEEKAVELIQNIMPQDMNLRVHLYQAAAESPLRFVQLLSKTHKNILHTDSEGHPSIHLTQEETRNFLQNFWRQYDAAHQ